ncbi:hypothetical protein [Streptomyces sp. SS]|uniref:hypothetical protein n=1 Tax=Streptomyces sp. SS TaxID=260742 RepID=UPI0003683EFE|nr:hypothetical protein [Streptomyces sp. SS]
MLQERLGEDLGILADEGLLEFGDGARLLLPVLRRRLDFDDGFLEVGDLLGELRDCFCHELLRFRPVRAKRRKAPAGDGKGSFVRGQPGR